MEEVFGSVYFKYSRWEWDNMSCYRAEILEKNKII